MTDSKQHSVRQAEGFKAWAMADSDPHTVWHIERHEARSLFEQLHTVQGQADTLLAQRDRYRDAHARLEEQLESVQASNAAAATLAGEFSVRVKVLEEQLEAARLLIARQLTPLDVAATHIDILRRKSEEYGPQERDNVAAIVESHVKEARHALFSGISNPASGSPVYDENFKLVDWNPASEPKEDA